MPLQHFLHSKKVNCVKQGAVDLSAYEESLKSSWVWEELEKVRNIRPAFRYGLYAGLLHGAIDTYFFRGGAPWTLKHRSVCMLVLDI